MRVLIVAGFLGSGKTSLILALAKRFARRGLRVAVVENEVGQEGVDGKILRGQGIGVREIHSGCVCCTLRGSLAAALRDLEASHAPDILVVEPSGVAAPDIVRDSVDTGPSPGARLVLALVVDCVRLNLVKTLRIPFVERSVLAADLILVNKCDREPEAAALHAAEARRANPAASVHAVSALAGVGLDEAEEEILSLLFRPPADPPPWRAGDAAGCVETRAAADMLAPRPVAVSASTRVDAPPAALAESMGRALDGLRGALAAAGCARPCHLKIVAEPAGGASPPLMAASVADLLDPPAVRGGPPQGAADAPSASFALSINAIVYGCGRPAAEAAVADALAAFKRAASAGTPL